MSSQQWASTNIYRFVISVKWHDLAKTFKHLLLFLVRNKIPNGSYTWGVIGWLPQLLGYRSTVSLCIRLKKKMRKREDKKKHYITLFNRDFLCCNHKHLQNIHKVMPSVDNTFISFLYPQKILYSEHMIQMLFSLCSL